MYQVKVETLLAPPQHVSYMTCLDPQHRDQGTGLFIVSDPADSQQRA